MFTVVDAHVMCVGMQRLGLSLMFIVSSVVRLLASEVGSESVRLLPVVLSESSFCSFRCVSLVSLLMPSGMVPVSLLLARFRYTSLVSLLRFVGMGLLVS